MENRTRILDAAARVYAEFGFRGATTRRIAQAAGVNEVTLFRTFGSKAALLDEAVRRGATAGIEASTATGHPLPDVPRDPERELTAWAIAQLAGLREMRSLIRKTMSEAEALPSAACTTAGWEAADDELHAYFARLDAAGFVAVTAAVGEAPGARQGEIHAAGAMLMAALFSDAMGRDMMPHLYPQPADRAPVLYVRLALRALACRPRPWAPAAAPRSTPKRATARRASSSTRAS